MTTETPTVRLSFGTGGHMYLSLPTRGLVGIYPDQDATRFIYKPSSVDLHAIILAATGELAKRQEAEAQAAGEPVREQVSEWQKVTNKRPGVGAREAVYHTPCGTLVYDGPVGNPASRRYAQAETALSQQEHVKVCTPAPATCAVLMPSVDVYDGEHYEKAIRRECGRVMPCLEHAPGPFRESQTVTYAGHREVEA